MCKSGQWTTVDTARTCTPGQGRWLFVRGKHSSKKEPSWRQATHLAPFGLAREALGTMRPSRRLPTNRTPSRAVNTMFAHKTGQNAFRTRLELYDVLAQFFVLCSCNTFATVSAILQPPQARQYTPQRRSFARRPTNPFRVQVLGMPSLHHCFELSLSSAMRPERSQTKAPGVVAP